MRLIDADAMCADLATVDPRYDTIVEWCIRVTEAQPTVDAVEVVRCKDCTSFYSGWCCDFGIHMDDNEFCSGGEKRR